MSKHKIPDKEIKLEKCQICGKASYNCASQYDALGRVVYCVCSNCLIHSTSSIAEYARIMIGKK